MPLSARQFPVCEVIRLDDAGVDGETFTLDQAGRHAAPQHFIEQPAEQIAVTKTAMAIL